VKFGTHKLTRSRLSYVGSDAPTMIKLIHD